MNKQQLNKRYGKVVSYIDRMFGNLNKITEKQVNDIAEYYLVSSNEVRNIIAELNGATKYTTV